MEIMQIVGWSCEQLAEINQMAVQSTVNYLATLHSFVFQSAFVVFNFCVLIAVLWSAYQIYDYAKSRIKIIQEQKKAKKEEKVRMPETKEPDFVEFDINGKKK